MQEKDEDCQIEIPVIARKLIDQHPELKPLIVIGTLRNEKGTSIYETIMNMLATWKQWGLNPSQALAESPSLEWAKS